MKKILSLIITLTLVLMVFTLSSKQDVSAEATSTCTTPYTLFVHYHRWDGVYTDTTIWAWGYGTAGSGEGAGVFEEDNFGATYQICVDDTDAGDEVGLINKYGAGWGDGSNDRDAVDTDANGSKDGNHKLISIRDDNGDLEGFDENGVKHVYVFEGSNQVIYNDDPNSLPFSEDLATIAVIYYDAAQSYTGWNIWTWGTGTLGTKGDPDPATGSGIQLVSQLGVDGSTVEDFRVAFINLDPADMGTEIGFIMRTDSWEKKNLNGENIMISTDGLVAGDFQTVFYIAGEGMMRMTFEDFEAVAHLFEIENALALGPGSIEVNFNKDVITKSNDVDVFDASAFTVKDKDGTEVVVANVSYNSTSDANAIFTLILEDDMMGSMAPYTVEYVSGDQTLSFDVDVDATAPEIYIIGATERQLELGDAYTLPAFGAYDIVGDESVAVYNVRVKEGHGTVDTRNTGEYEIVITATDKFGNVAEKTITVTVVDPCEEPEANNPANLAALFVGLPLAIGAVITSRRWS